MGPASLHGISRPPVPLLTTTDSCRMKCLLLVSLAAVAAAAPQYGHDDYNKPYAYEYSVHTPYGGEFSQTEHSDGHGVRGQYGVQTKGGSTHVTYYGAHGYGSAHGYGGAHGSAYKPAPVYHKPAPVYHKAAPVYHQPAYKPAPVYHKPAPVYHPAPAYHKPAPVYHKPAPVYHKPAPVYHKPAPVYHKPAPVYHKPAPVYHPAPAYHKPAPAYHNPAPVYH